MKSNNKNKSRAKGTGESSSDRDLSSRRTQNTRGSRDASNRDEYSNNDFGSRSRSSGEGQYPTGAPRYEYESRDYGDDESSHRGLTGAGVGAQSGRLYDSGRNDSSDRDYRDDYQNQHFGADHRDTGRGRNEDQTWMDRSSTGSHMSEQNLSRGSRDQGRGENDRSYSSRGMYGNQGLHNPATSSLSRQRETQRVWDSGRESGHRNENYGNSGHDDHDRNVFERASDWLSEKAGRFVGKGPKGYKRADDRIHDDVCDALARHPHIDASEIEVVVKEGEVTLTGTIDSRQAKRLAEDVSERCSGVRDVHNQIRVANASSGANTDASKNTRTDNASTGSTKTTPTGSTNNQTSSSTRRTS